MSYVSKAKLIYAILVHGIAGDFYHIEEIEDASGVNGLKTPKNGQYLHDAIQKCKRAGVIWVRQRGVGVFCSQSPNKSRQHCKADPEAVCLS